MSALSQWPVASGVSWIQTADPSIARKLAKRSDTRHVATGVAGGFLRIFEMKHSPAFMRCLVARYNAANERFSKLGDAQRGSKCSSNGVTAGGGKTREIGV